MSAGTARRCGEGLGEDEPIARRQAAHTHQRRPVRGQAEHGEARDELGPRGRVAADERDLLRVERGARSRQDLVQRLLGLLGSCLGHRYLRQGEARGDALGPEVARGIDRGDAAHQIRIVGEGAEAVDARHDHLAARGRDGGHVVALVQAEQDRGIDGRADPLEGPR